MPFAAGYETWRDGDVNIEQVVLEVIEGDICCRKPDSVSVEKGALRLFGEVCHRMRRPRTTRIAP
jgi:hypothetical protein